MASTIFLVSFVVAEKEGSHTGGVSIRGILSGLGLRTKDVFTKLPRDVSWGSDGWSPVGWSRCGK